MKKMKLSYAQWQKIRRYTKFHWKEYLFCCFTLSQSNSTFRIQANVRWIWHIILFIPVMILNFLWCLIDGGLKEFEFPVNRLVTYDYIFSGNSVYKYCEELWNA